MKGLSSRDNIQDPEGNIYLLKGGSGLHKSEVFARAVTL